MTSPTPAMMRPTAWQQSLAAAFAVLWLLYALSGTANLCRTAPSFAMQHGSLASAGTLHYCPMCHTMMRRGAPCCCKTAPVPSPTAALSARCDQGAPAALAAATSWPVLRPGTAFSIVLPIRRRPGFIRPGHQFTASLSISPLTPPPCV